jgi:ubiquinone/menaquinone biosynthesis C-methylase UbiE
LNLLPQESLVRTSRVDHADWNYRPHLAPIMRRRFALALSLLPSERVHRLLEIGFGSGVFMPTLAQKCSELYGIDVHDRVPEVQARLAAHGVHTNLSWQDAAGTRFADGFFDAIVSVSALEFVERIDEATAEIARLLDPAGRAIVVMPCKSPVVDFMLFALTGEDAKRDYGNRRERVLPTMLQHLRIVRRKDFLQIYSAYEFALPDR